MSLKLAVKSNIPYNTRKVICLSFLALSVIKAAPIEKERINFSQVEQEVMTVKMAVLTNQYTRQKKEKNLLL